MTTYCYDLLWNEVIVIVKREYRMWIKRKYRMWKFPFWALCYRKPAFHNLSNRWSVYVLIVCSSFKVKIVLFCYTCNWLFMKLFAELSFNHGYEFIVILLVWKVYHSSVSFSDSLQGVHRWHLSIGFVFVNIRVMLVINILIFPGVCRLFLKE